MSDDLLGDESPPLRFRTRVVEDGYAYWASKCVDGRLPSRQDINPLEIPRLMPHVAIVDVRHEPEMDFFYRLQGTYIVEHLYQDHSGKWFSEIPHQKPPSQIWSNCAKVVESKMPLLANTPYVGPQSSFRDLEDLILPLSSDGELVDSLLVFVCYLPRSNT
ncbi:MAG: PAS domain-containing protein [Alphaproteobacteria bacterium]